MRRIENAMIELNRMSRSGRADRQRSELAGVDLTGVAQRLLHPVFEHGPQRLAEIARRTGTDPGIVTRQVDVIEREGLVERRPDPTDRRALLLHLTRKGRRIAAELRAVQDEIFARQLADWSKAELESAARVMERLVGDLRPRSSNPSDE
jgi:DNA-binding MarR family transcriptional regulator